MSKPFTLLEKYWDKFGSNAYKFEDKVLLNAFTTASGNTEHLKDDNEWGEVDIRAFSTDEEYDELYKLAENPNNRIYIKENEDE
tara:strand:+ start:891 stop:1142 length:252 start_codon:yes stop_codon:yes gene_type:complete